MKTPKCPECHSLWLEYARVTTEHIRLDSKLRLAALSHDHEVMQGLTREVESAKAVRHSMRETIRKHEGTHEATHETNYAVDDAAD